MFWEKLNDSLCSLGVALGDYIGKEVFDSFNIKGEFASGDPASRYLAEDAYQDYLNILPKLNEDQLDAFWKMYPRLSSFLSVEMAAASKVHRVNPARLGQEGMKKYFEWVRASHSKIVGPGEEEGDNHNCETKRRRYLNQTEKKRAALIIKQQNKDGSTQRKLKEVKSAMPGAWYETEIYVKELEKRIQAQENAEAASESKQQVKGSPSHIIEARGGAGKTMYLNLLEAHCRAHAIPFVSMAFSGYASSTLDFEILSFILAAKTLILECENFNKVL